MAMTTEPVTLIKEIATILCQQFGGLSEAEAQAIAMRMVLRILVMEAKS